LASQTSFFEPSGIAAAGEHVFAVGHAGGDALGGGAFHFPVRLAGERVEAGDQVATGKEQLRFASGGEHNW